VTVAPPDFAIQAFPNPVTLVAGVPGSSSTSITLTSTNNLVGTISLSTSAPPSGISATLNPSSVSLTANSTGTSTLSISNANSVPAGIYTLVVTGTNQSLTHSVMLQINVVDFTISASPSGLVIGTGTSGSTTILIGSLGSLTGNVNLTATVSSPGVTASLSATIIPVSQFATGTSALKITVSKSTPTNKYNVTVTGVTIVNGHTITHSTIVSVSLPPPDFSITATPSNLAANPDSSASSTILLTSLNNFAGTVTLSVTSPSTVTSSTSPTNLSLNAGTTATSTWSMSGTTRGTYTVTVSSSSGSLGHTISVTFTVGVGLVCIQDPT